MTYRVLPPESESARLGAASGDCFGGGVGMPPPETLSSPRPAVGLFDVAAARKMTQSAARSTSCPPLTGNGPGRDGFWPRVRDRLRLAGFWAGEMLGAASLFVILFVLLFFAGAMQ